MTSPNAKASAAEVAEAPWYDLLCDAPGPPEDAMQQDDTIHQVMSVLRARYEDDPTVLCSDETNLIYDSAVPGSVVVPDGYIVFGVDAGTIKRERRSYRIDEWGQSPAFVLEVASESTASNDLNEKREIYARMGAQEYWRLDRLRYLYGEPLVGERLVNGEYERLELHREANGDVWCGSEVLGIEFVYRPEGDYGRFLLRDSATGEWLNTLAEERAAHAATEAARQAAEAEAEVERQMRQAAEARNEELEAELERLRRHES